MKVFFFVFISTLVLVALGDEAKIRQCTCEEMEQCRRQIHEQIKPCTDACKEKLTAPGLDPEKAKQCFEHKPDKSHSCHEELRSKMCAADESTFLSLNETWHGRHKNKKNIDNSIEDENSGSKKLVGGWHHHHHHHHRHHHHHWGFIHFIKINFGDSAKKFGKCMRSCFKSKKHGCMKNLGCGVKKLSRADFKAHHESCKSHREEKHQELCNCLTQAGMKKVICEFGKKKSD